MLPAASFVLTSHTVLLPSVGAPCILPVLTIVIATQLLEPQITERELPSPRHFSETLFVMLNTRDVFYVRREVDCMKTAKVNAYIMHIFGKIELLSIHAT